MMRNDVIIDESLPQLAEYVAGILVDDGVNKSERLDKLFKSYANYLKENVAPGEPDQGDITSGKPRINDDEDVNVLDPKLEAMVAAAMALPVNRGTDDEEPVTTPPMSRQEALNWLMRTAEGRSFAAHHAKTTKKAEPMIDITKLHNIQSVVEVAKAIIAKDGDGITEHEFSEILMGHCRLNKRANESDAAAFSRIFQDPDNADIRKAYAMTKGYCQP